MDAQNTAGRHGFLYRSNRKIAYICFLCMIVYLNGNYVLKTPAYVWMEVNGIGYEVNISLNTFSRIQHLEKGRLFTHLHIREDAHSLYGFFDEQERTLFLHLISVSGVGTATARMMLSSMRPEEIIQAIRSENEAALGRIKGIGPKSAKRLILELKDKIMKLSPEGAIIEAPAHNNLENDALNALMSLGIARQAAGNAIKKAMQEESEPSLEMLIKRSLKNL